MHMLSFAFILQLADKPQVLEVLHDRRVRICLHVTTRTSNRKV